MYSLQSEAELSWEPWDHPTLGYTWKIAFYQSPAPPQPLQRPQQGGAVGFGGTSIAGHGIWHLLGVVLGCSHLEERCGVYRQRYGLALGHPNVLPAYLSTLWVL